MNAVRIINTLPSNPKVALFARAWKCSQDEALGRMVRWLCWLDMHTPDGRTGLTEDELNRLVFSGKKHTAVLLHMGWAAVNEDGFIYSVNFEKHNGRATKVRRAATEKKRKYRANKKENERH